MENKKLTDMIPPYNPLLPKKLEGSEDGNKILTFLNSNLKPVQFLKEYMMPVLSGSQSIFNALNSIRRAKRLIRGFEDAEKKLNAERVGIKKVDNKTGSERIERISRIVVVTNDGSERFYRQTKKLVEQNSPRVMAIYLDISSFDLGERLFGPGKRALCLLINHKEAVINFLTSLIN